MNLILQGALNDSEQHAAALDGLAQVSPIVARYAEVEVIYQRKRNTTLEREFEIGLVDLYAEILKYQISAACHCERSTFQRLLRALPKLDDWQGMIQNIKMKDAACQDMTRIFDSQDQKLVNFKLQSLAEKNEEMMKAFLDVLRNVSEERKQQNNRIPRWVCSHVAGRDHQNILSKGKLGVEYANSGQWLLNHPRFLKWASPERDKPPVLWICGAVGSGKSSVVCRVIEWHLERASSREDDQVIYFYCSRTGGEDQDPGIPPATVLSGMVSQLCWSPDGSGIQEAVSNLYKRLQSERPDEASLSLEESVKLIVELSGSCAQTTIIIDALDECSQPYPLLRALQDILDKTAGRLKLFVSSRVNVDVPSAVTTVSRINLHAEDTFTDVHDYVWKEVKQSKRRLLKGKEPELEDKVVETLSYRAQGM